MTQERPSSDRSYLRNMMLESFRRESEAAALYEMAAQAERDERRSSVLGKLAEIERGHARMWQAKLAEMGADVGELAQAARPGRVRPTDLVRRLEALERGNAVWYETQRALVTDPEITSLIDTIDEEESHHEDSLHEVFLSPFGASLDTLRHIWGRERFHKKGTGGWLGDAIYGVNDGLGAIFGIIAGVAGYTDNSQTVLVSGFFGALASTLSMGAGAWLATKSEAELNEREMHLERQEIEQSPEHEQEELALLYELKGFTTGEAHDIADRIAKKPDTFLRVMAAEELGIHEDAAGSPWVSAFTGSISTFVGGVVPLIPFFFMRGVSAMIAAAVISLIAHFAVGAAKSLVTARSWFASGIEMTMAGVIVGVISYGIGVLGTLLVHM